MCASTLVNSLGLLLDIAGAVLIYLYGLPEAITRSGAVYLVTEETDEAERARARRYDRTARCGIALLVAGFVLQLISNFL